MDGLDGWVQSEPNFVDVGGDVYPRAYVRDFASGAVGFAVGGYYDTEDFTAGPLLTVSQSLAGLAANVARFSARFQLLDSEEYNVPGDSSSGYFDTDRNTFLVGYRSGGNEFLSVNFVPNSQSADPANDEATWNANVSIFGVPLPAFAAVFEDGVYGLNITTSQNVGNPADLDYNVRLFSEDGTSFSDSGTMLGESGATLDDVFVGWRNDVSGDLGSNEIAFSKLTVVPETSSVLALSLCITGCLMARKR